MNKSADEWNKMSDKDRRSLEDAYDAAENEYMKANTFAKEERKKAVDYLLGKYGDKKITSKNKYMTTARDWLDSYLTYDDGVDWYYENGSYDYYEPNDDFKKYGIR